MAVATGMLTSPHDNVRNALAATPAFQSWVGAADMAEALTRIHFRSTVFIDTAPPSSLSRPLVLFGPGENWKVTRSSNRGETILLFVANVDEAHTGSDEDAGYAFLNQIGACLQEMWQREEYVVIQQIEDYEEPPSRSLDDDEPETGQDYYRAPLTLTWGV